MPKSPNEKPSKTAAEKITPTWDKREALLHPLVIASKTSALKSACDLLFINGNDLAWEDWIEGLYLADISDESALQAIMQVMNARSEVATADLLHAYAPTLRSTLHRAIGAVGDDESDENAAQKMIAGIVSEYRDKGLKHYLRPANEQRLDVQRVVTQFLTLGVGRSALQMRQRILGATGLGIAEYRDMLAALRRIGACEAVFRVAFTRNGFTPEWSMSGGFGFEATQVRPEAVSVDIYRLTQTLSDAKRGQDMALAMFIAHFLNRHSMLERPVAFAGYRPRGKDGPEHDVLIPRLRVGCEVKVYQGPAVKSASAIPNLVNDIKNQIGDYFAAGCERIYYITNLPGRLAESVVEEVMRPRPHHEHGRVVAITGRETLLGLLGTLSTELGKTFESDWAAGLEGVRERQRARHAREAERPANTEPPEPGTSDPVGSTSGRHPDARRVSPRNRNGTQPGAKGVHASGPKHADGTGTGPAASAGDSSRRSESSRSGRHRSGRA